MGPVVRSMCLCELVLYKELQPYCTFMPCRDSMTLLLVVRSPVNRNCNAVASWQLEAHAGLASYRLSVACVTASIVPYSHSSLIKI